MTELKIGSDGSVTITFSGPMTFNHANEVGQIDARAIAEAVKAEVIVILNRHGLREGNWGSWVDAVKEIGETDFAAKVAANGR